MSEREKCTLDFSNCKYLGEVHEIIREKMRLPEWYGANLDALWDSFWGIACIPDDFTIIYKPEPDVEVVPREAIEKIVGVFKEHEEMYGDITVTVEM